MHHALRAAQPLFWCQSGLPGARVRSLESLRAKWWESNISMPRRRLQRWAGALGVLFPELAGAGGLIESPLMALDDPLAVAGWSTPTAA